MYFELYNVCLSKHPSAYIELEKIIVESNLGAVFYDHDSCAIKEKLEYKNILSEFEKIDLENKIYKQNFNKNLFYYIEPNYQKPSHGIVEAQAFLAKGLILNDLCLYQDAIASLTQSIKLNPFSQIVYVERMLAYFENNEIDLALKDYLEAKRLSSPIFSPIMDYTTALTDSYIMQSKVDFSRGLVSGTIDGAQLSMLELVPSIFSSCRGISHGLWAFACAPIEVTQELVNAAYAVGEFLQNHSAEECLQCVVPELRDLMLSWHHISDYSRGQKFGYIIGKYGIDIFAPIGILKGLGKLRALKRANAMYTLENCAISETRRAKILETSSKRAAMREISVVETFKKNKIFTRNSNTSHHVMQNKHAWDKVIKLSGNVEEDFKTVLILLEEQDITSHQYSKQIFQVADGVVRREHQKTFLNQKIVVIFNEYTHTGEIFLNNAWVVTK